MNRERVDWNAVDTVLLDMDGTLLDRHFDDFFWERHVPEQYARKHGIPVEAARRELLARYRREEGRLTWTDLDFWSRELGLDIPALKAQVEHLIQVHPYVPDFLAFVRRKGKGLYLVTNAHSKTLDLKMRKTRLGPVFDGILSAHELGWPKEDPRFWHALRVRLGFDPARTLLAEDSEDNLRAARTAGIRHLIYVAKPSTARPAAPSAEFPSIVYFKELLPEEAEP